MRGIGFDVKRCSWRGTLPAQFGSRRSRLRVDGPMEACGCCAEALRRRLATRLHGDAVATFLGLEELLQSNL